MKRLPDKEWTTTVESGSWPATASRMGRRGSVDSIENHGGRRVLRKRCGLLGDAATRGAAAANLRRLRTGERMKDLAAVAAIGEVRGLSWTTASKLAAGLEQKD